MKCTSRAYTMHKRSNTSSVPSFPSLSLSRSLSFSRFTCTSNVAQNWQREASERQAERMSRGDAAKDLILVPEPVPFKPPPDAHVVQDSSVSNNVHAHASPASESPKSASKCLAIERFKSLGAAPRELWLMMTLNFLESFAYFSFSLILANYLTSVFGYSDSEAGYLYGIFGTVVAASGYVDERF